MRIEKIGRATLYLGDCREVLPLLDKVDLILTDPPYGIGVDVKMKKTANKKSKNGAAYKKDYGETNWDSEPPEKSTFDLILSKSQNSIIFGGNYFPLPPTSCYLVWDKDNGATNFADCELAWTNLNKAVRLFRYTWNGMLQGDMKNKEVREHPTQKPVPVMQWCIGQSPKDVKTICDPFLGSGSTGVAAVKMGKEFIGIEREPSYFDIACRRIEKAQQQQDLFGYQD